MTLLDRIVAHCEPERRRSIDIPEWGEDGKPLSITYSMVTLDDLAAVYEMDQSTDFNKNAARIVALKACDADGRRLFKSTDATMLRTKADPGVVKQIAMKMLARTSIEDAEKN